jgi:5-methylcytosine-specific restriction endonuclease McrBC regulatory subunit McrC
LITSKRVSLVAGRNGSEISFPFANVKDTLSNHAEELKNLLTWSIDQDEIIFRPKPEAFGLVKISNTIIEVSPKFLSIEEKLPTSFISDLFNVTGEPKINFISPAESDLSGTPSSLFDWYFYSILNQVNDFLKRYDRMVMHSYEETLTGIRGRLKVVESIRASKGLKHINVCELQTTQPRLEFLGTIKGFVNVLGAFSDNKAVKSLVDRCNSHLRNIPELPFDRSSIRKLKQQSKLLVSEHRKAKPILNSIFGLFNLIEVGVGSVTHHCFNFNMNTQFELLVLKLLEAYKTPHSWTLKSGNDRALTLLNNKCIGLQIDDEQDSFTTDSIIIKPDAYLVGLEENIVATIDAKYKMLNYDSSNEVFSGVQSKDVQQVLTYWMHFQNEQDSPLTIGIMYPHPTPASATKLISKIGSINLENPINNTPLSIDIFAVNIPKAVRELAAGSKLDDLNLKHLLAA